MMLPENLNPCTTEKMCDDNDATIFPIMKHYVEVEKLSINKSGKLTSILYPDGKVSDKRAVGVYQRRKGKTRGLVENKQRKQTDKETKIQLKKVVKEMKACKVSDTDIKEVVDAAADLVSEGRASVRVVMKVPEALRKQRALTSYKSKRERRQESDIDKMTRNFHIFLERLDKVLASGSNKLSDQDKMTMDREFKLMVPRLLRLLDWMGIDLQSLVTNYVNRYKEVGHEKQDAKGLLGN